jgi:hypothetical protein
MHTLLYDTAVSSVPQALNDPFEPSFEVAAKVDVDNASLLVTESEGIAEGFGALEGGEPIRLTRNWDILGCLSREHDEHACVRSTLIDLASGMQVARPMPECGRTHATSGKALWLGLSAAGLTPAYAPMTFR